MNIIVAVIDTLRRDYIGAYGNDWIETPNMDDLADRSWVFDYSFTSSYPTIPHRTDAMTGSYGAPFNPWMPLRHDRMTFPEELGKTGYCTQLIHDTPHLVNGGHNFDWPFHAWTPVRGAEVDRPWIDDSTEWPENWAWDPRFDYVDDSVLNNMLLSTYSRSNRKRKAHEDWNCAKLFRTASDWLRDNQSRDNFLLWVDCFDPHEPWDAPPEFMTKYDKTPNYQGTIDPRSFAARNGEAVTDKAREHIAAQYAAKVSWVDRWFGELLDTLDETGLAKNTAILLTADHGTNVGERQRFGKGYPVREQEARTPFIVHVPGGGSGCSDLIVQPQDIFATVFGMAKKECPEGIESHDVLGLARSGDEGPRQIAVASGRTDGWAGETEKILFTAFDREWCLEFAAKPECCQLVRHGTTEDVAADNQDVVERMRAAALDEIEHRGADPALSEWLRSEGEKDWPEDCCFWDGYPGPAGYHAYFGRIYMGD